jgi:hypothetical protein
VCIKAGLSGHEVTLSDEYMTHGVMAHETFRKFPSACCSCREMVVTAVNGAFKTMGFSGHRFHDPFHASVGA